MPEGGYGRVYQVLWPVIGSKTASNSVPNVTPDAINDFFVSFGPKTAASVVPTGPLANRLPPAPACGLRVTRFQ